MARLWWIVRRPAQRQHLKERMGLIRLHLLWILFGGGEHRPLLRSKQLPERGIRVVRRMQRLRSDLAVFPEVVDVVLESPDRACDCRVAVDKRERNIILNDNGKAWYE